MTISGRHVDVTETMGNRIREHIDRLPRFDDQIRHITVTLANDAGGHHVEIICQCHNAVLVTNAQGQEMYGSIEEAFSKMERRVARLHEKLIGRHSRQARHASEFSKKPEP